MNKKGFTLIELMAVIIILGVLMIIAVPSVTKYIEESRKNGYVTTAKNIANGVRNMLYSGALKLDDKNTTYYVDARCAKTENAYKSPYGDFVNAYVVVAPSYDNYEYFWTSVDNAGRGVKGLINVNNLDVENIEADINSSDITTDRGIDDRDYIVRVNESCQKGESETRTGPKIDSITGKPIFLCRRATTLHKKTCQRQAGSNYYGCGSIIGYGNEITYGTIPDGSPQTGDAYDCDVNNDKVYDSETERFYYLTSADDKSTLIYYTNYNNATYAYDNSRANRFGPITAYQYLPSVSEWRNKGIIPQGERKIYASNSRAQYFESTGSGTIQQFSYSGKAARLLSVQDIVAIIGTYIPDHGALNDYLFFFENIPGFELDNAPVPGNYWLENPAANRTDEAMMVYSGGRSVNTSTTDINDSLGIRPVITVKTSDIE